MVCKLHQMATGFVIGTAIVAISQNPVIEIGVATPHHACIRNFLRNGSSREFVASEASFGRTARHERDGEAGAFDRKLLSEQEVVGQWHPPSRPTTPKLPPAHNPRT